nr:hypothetical protein [Tanacetum cinerariifolium]
EEVVGIVGTGYAVPLRIMLPGRVPEPEDEALQLEVVEFRVDEPELDKLVLDKLEVGFDLGIGAIGPPRPFKDGWHNSFILWRSGTGRSPFPSAAILELFKRVGSERDLLQI